MQKIRMERGSHHDEDPEVTYVIQLIKFKNRKFDNGQVIKEFFLDRGKKTILEFNVR